VTLGAPPAEGIESPAPSAMIFSTPVFIFGFLPAVLAVYFLVPPRLRNYVALAFSFLFYAWGAPQFIAVVFLSCFFDWYVTNRLHEASDPVRKKRLMALAVSQNILVLAYFKYADFSINAANSVMAFFGVEPFPLLEIALPIGISFITFEKITYIVDIYRDEGHPSKKFSTYLLYVHFFPQLIAGPIIKYHDIETQFDEREYSFDNVVVGMSRFSVGLAKKVLLADSLAVTSDKAFSLDPTQLDPLGAWLGIISYTLQLYFDFSGYSDMAIGMARAMGFRFLENFNMPYISRNITEFWKRWHISLSTWIRSYLYYPLGGNRVSPIRTHFNLWICFVLCGLWHGAAYTYVIYGVYQGTFMIFEKLFWLDFQKRLPGWFNILACFLVTMMGFVIFRCETMTQAGHYMLALFLNPGSAASGIILDRDVALYISVGLAICFFPATRLYEPVMGWFYRFRYRDEVFTSYALVVFILSAGRIAGSSFSPFLYFRF
jgi:alginate O-acetyltransferase complex protein AlgI